jgi:RNA-directed DNA polymerase
MTAFTFAVAMAALGVNGPEDVVREWDAISWRLHEDNVRGYGSESSRRFGTGTWPRPGTCRS